MPDSDRPPGAGWRNTVLVVAVAALIVRFLFPPVGVVLFMVTTVMAASRFRQMPWLTVLVALAAVFAATSMPPSFLSAHSLSDVGLVQDSQRRAGHIGAMTSTYVTELTAFTIDCSDAARLARFYAELTGGEVTADYPEYGVAQTTTLGATLNFQGVKGYARPAWPGQDHPQQYHLDFRVTDLEKATEHAIELGATRAEEQPNEKLWRVMIDPDGHPFCLCPPRA